jgi:hypothetical protein
MDEDQWAEYAHEEILQALIRHLLTTGELHELCDEADLPTLIDGHGKPVSVRSAATYRDAGVLTLDRGVLVELSDGSAFGLTICVSRRPDVDVTVRTQQ